MSATGRVHYYDPRKRKVVAKGEASGHFQEIVEIRLNCTGDQLLLKVRPAGGACELGYQSCFFPPPGRRRLGNRRPQGLRPGRRSTRRSPFRIRRVGRGSGPSRRPPHPTPPRPTDVRVHSRRAKASSYLCELWHPLGHWGSWGGGKGPDEPLALSPNKSLLTYILIRPAAILAAMTVFFMSMVMVMGPTPPGTGVMKEALAAQDSKCDVALQDGLAGLLADADPVDADVDDTAAFFDPVALDVFGHARGHDEDVGPAAVLDDLILGGAGVDAGDGGVGALAASGS